MFLIHFNVHVGKLETLKDDVFEIKCDLLKSMVNVMTENSELQESAPLHRKITKALVSDRYSFFCFFFSLIFSLIRISIMF